MPFMEEKWKVIKDFPDYEISTKGRVKRITRGPSTWPGRILKGSYIERGYPILALRKNNKSHYFRIHRLMGKIFLPNWESKKETNHKDGNKTNNDIENLEMVSKLENARHAVKIGIIPFGENHWNSKLKLFQVMEIKNLLNQGIPIRKVAKQYFITRGAIEAIKYNKSWRRI